MACDGEIPGAASARTAAGSDIGITVAREYVCA
jgi:hypothetical protein